MATILVSDDDPKLLKMVRRTLAYEGFQVLTASDGRETLAQVREKRPDLIILDWMMPELDGVEVLKRLREAGDDVPVLMLTARDTVQDRVEGVKEGEFRVIRELVGRGDATQRDFPFVLHARAHWAWGRRALRLSSASRSR